MYKLLNLADINRQSVIPIILNYTPLLKSWHFTDTTIIIIVCFIAKIAVLYCGQK